MTTTAPAALVAILLASGCGSVGGDAADAGVLTRVDGSTNDDDGGSANIDAGPPCGDGNYVLSFDGAQLVSVPDSAFVRPSGDLTIEAWVRFDAIEEGDYHSIVIKTFGPESKDSYALWYYAVTGTLQGMINLGTEGSVGLEHPWVPALGQWYFLAFSFDLASHMQRLYIDGDEVASVVNDQTPAYDGHRLTIGSDYGFDTSGGQFIGRIDEVRLFDVARTEAELAADATSCSGAAPGLRGYWRFNEGSGQAAQDSTGQGNLGTLGLEVAATPEDPTWVLSTDPFLR